MVGNPPAGGMIMSEYENTGSSAILAFKGRWTMVDDLGEKVEDQEVRYTSDMDYAGEAGAKGPHVIAPGESIMIIDSSINGETKTIATTKSGALKMAQFYSGVKEAKLDDFAVERKFTFEVEKVVSP